MGIRKAALYMSAALLLALSPIDTMAQTQQAPAQPQTQPQRPQTTPVITPPQGDVVREQPVAVLDRERPEYDAPGRRLGGFELNASLDLEATSTDNLFAAAEDNVLQTYVDDIYFEITPTVRLASDWSRHALAAEGSYTSKTHEDFGSEDAETWYLRGSGRFDISEATSLSAAARAAHQVEPRTDPDSTSGGTPTEYDRTDLTAGAQHRFARVLVRGDVDWVEHDYEGVVDSIRDNELSRLRGRAEIDVTPRLDLLLQASLDEYDYALLDLGPLGTFNLDSEGQTYLIGVALDGDLVTGEISVGYFERDFKEPDVETFDGMAVAAALEWYITRLTTITFSGRQNADDQIGGTTFEPYIVTEFGARVDHELLRNLILSLGALGGKRDYRNIDRHDEYVEFELGADWLINPHAALLLRYEYDENESEGIDVTRPDFQVNAVTLGLSLRL